MKHLFRSGALFGVLLLAGCGFHPIYGERVGGEALPVVADLNNIAIENIPDRKGQILRNYLIDRLYRDNRPELPRYILKINIVSFEQDLGILANATATRALLDMRGTYTLEDRTTKKIVLSGQAHSVAGFDRLDQMYGTVAARQDAQERTLREIGEQIVNRLSLYFSEEERASKS
ncbi:MAG: LPS assembly lipoprotein LptE [Alphaproteobacteria bacterium]|nr:LPS assembly lipoprotein LptE [Alphaproteobacteria bacterium]